jgi:hypothetical protein
MNKSRIKIYFRQFGFLGYRPVFWSEKELKDKILLKAYKVIQLKL